MAELDYKTAAASVPPLPERSATPTPVATGDKAGEVSGLVADKNATAKSVIAKGGNRGGKPRLDGLVPGSAEAAEADRKKDAERKKADRARAAQQREQTQLPPPLAPGTSVTSESAPPVAAVAGVAYVEAVAWYPADFKFVVPDCISFTETWRIRSKTKKAIEGHLPPAVAEQIGNSFAFPVETKESLRGSSPESLAKLFNALRVPVSFKPIISAVPALSYIIARDAQLDAKLDKMIADEAERRKGREERETLNEVRKASEGPAFRE